MYSQLTGKLCDGRHRHGELTTPGGEHSWWAGRSCPLLNIRILLAAASAACRGMTVPCPKLFLTVHGEVCWLLLLRRGVCQSSYRLNTQSSTRYSPGNICGAPGHELYRPLVSIFFHLRSCEKTPYPQFISKKRGATNFPKWQSQGLS